MQKPNAKIVAIALSLLGFCPSALLAQSSQSPDGPGRLGVNVTQFEGEVAERFRLNYAQRSRLLALLRNTSPRNDLISTDDRAEMAVYGSSLTPELRQQLRRGQNLPRGIERPIYLSRQVNDFLELPRQNVDLIVVGSNVVIVDSFSGFIHDLVVCPGIFEGHRC